ncbi:Exosome complex component RRP43 [Nymphon striatum]|nr:Exosome complex component RRP43 [Nymphon striatum]
MAEEFKFDINSRWISFSEDGKYMRTMWNKGSEYQNALFHEFAEPTQDKPKEGFIVPNLELPPLCSPTFRPGPPSDQAQVCSQFLSDVIKSSKCINAEDLVIKAGKLVWCIYIDLTCLDYDGNVLDASVIAMTAALYNLSLPKVEFIDEEIKVNPAIKIPINMRNVPVATTFGIFDKIFLADPTNEEENLISERITIVTIDNDILCDIHKPGGTAISEEDLQDCIKRANKHFRNVLDLLKAAKNNDNR